MINFINSWTEGIIIAVVISTIIEMILPDGTIKKYVRTVIGTYIVFVIVSPIITKLTGKEITLSSFKLPETQIQTENTINTNAYIESTYINTIKQDIIKNIENKGYKVEEIKVEIETEKENYGNINEINLKISKDDTKNSNIKPVEINLNEEVHNTEIIEEKEIQEIKDFLQMTYGTETILIN